MNSSNAFGVLIACVLVIGSAGCAADTEEDEGVEAATTSDELVSGPTCRNSVGPFDQKSAIPSVRLDTNDSLAVCAANVSSRLATLTARYCALHPRGTYRTSSAYFKPGQTFGQLLISPYANLVARRCP